MHGRVEGGIRQRLGKPRHVDRARKRQWQSSRLLEIAGRVIEATTRLRHDTATDVPKVTRHCAKHGDCTNRGTGATVALKTKAQTDRRRACRDDALC